jgi:hypothetical protein
MKKLFYLFLFVIACNPMLFAQIPTANLIARYPFSGNANDVSGNALNGTVNGATLVADHNGTTNDAYDFTYGNSITVSSQPILDNGFGLGITLATWVYITSPGQSARLIDRTLVGNNSGFILDLVNGQLRFIGDRTIGANMSSITVPTNTWTHVAITFNNSTGTLIYYVNGVSTQTFNNSTRLVGTATNLPLLFGRDQSGGSLFVGSMDEPSIYGRALSLCEIRALAGLGQLTTPITGNNTVCVNQLLLLSNATSGGTWSSSNTAVATVNSFGLVSGISAGPAVITYTVPSGGCQLVANFPITVNSTLVFTIVGNSTVCPNSSGNGYTVSPIVSNADYTWNIQNGPNVGVNFPVNGSTNTTLTIPNSVTNNQFILRCQGLNLCGSSAIVSKTITLSTDVPAVPNVTCSGTSGSNTCVNLTVTNAGTSSIQWIVNGVVQGTSNTFVRPLNSSVLCTFTSPSGCTKSTWYSPAVVCTYQARTSNTASDNYTGLVLYPNPNAGNFTIKTNNYNGKALVYSILGVVVDEITVTDANNSYNLDISDKPKGTYLLKLTGGDQDHVSVFVVQ